MVSDYYIDGSNGRLYIHAGPWSAPKSEKGNKLTFHFPFPSSALIMVCGFSETNLKKKLERRQIDYY